MCDSDTQCEAYESDWYKVVQKQIFLNCVSSSSSPVSSSSSPLGLVEVSISTVIDYLYKHFSETGQTNEFLESLRKSLTKVSPNGRIDWKLFQEGSRLWFSNLQRFKVQDGNNNNEDDDDDLARDSTSSGEERREHQDENNSERETNSIRGSSSPLYRVFDVSSYSPDSNSTQRLTDATAESEIEMGYDIDAAIDLRLRIRKFDEENATLREEILRFEDLNANLQQRINSLNRRLEQLTVQCKNLQRENDEQKDLLRETEQQEKSSKLALHKAIKEKMLLEKKLEAIQTHNESITALKSELIHLIQENKKFARLNEDYQNAFEEKNVESESLKRTIAELEETNANLQKTYESSVQYLREKNQELQNQNLELQTRSANNGSDRLSVTPPMGYINSYMHSTPYTVQNISPRRSLYAELKASGFSPDGAKNNSKIAEMEEEFNDEISFVVEQIDSIIQRLAVAGQKPFVPNLNLQEDSLKMSSLHTLKQKIADLMNLVPDRIWKCETKDCGLQVLIETPKDHRQFSDSIDNDSVALSETSMTSRSVETTCETEESDECSSEKVISNLKSKSPQVQFQKNSIIDPIVQVLDQIIQDSIEDDSGLQKAFNANNQKRRGIYTHTRPPTPNPEVKISLCSESPNSIKHEETHCVSSRGDAREIPPEINFQSIPRYHSTNSSFSPENSMRSSKISTDSTMSEDEKKKPELAAVTYCVTPSSKVNMKIIPRRKLSVFHRSFDVESLQVSRNDKEDFREKRRSVSTPVHEEDHERTDNCNAITRTSLLNSYRSTKSASDSSESISPPKNDVQDEDVFKPTLENQKSRPLVLAPTKLILHQKVEKIENRRFDETRIILKDSKFLEEVDKKEKEYKNLNQITFRKNFKIFEESTRGVASKENEKDSKFCGDTTLSRVDVRKENTTSTSPLLFDSVERIDETIYSDNSSMSNTSKGTNMSSFQEKTYGVPLPSTKICSTISNNSGAVVTENEKASKISSPVVSAMSSGEDSSDSECDRINSKDDRQVTVSVPINVCKHPDPLLKHKISADSQKPEEKSELRIREQKIRLHRRSLSEGETIGCRRKECRRQIDTMIMTPLQALEKDGIHPRAFPSLSDDRLQESGIANFSDLQSEFGEDLSEEDLERKYTALSVGLRTDRMTLSRRLTFSQRQRNQAESNLATELEKMQQDIQDLAPLCTDRESLERVERVRRQLEMIAQCARRVSCTAETLGAVHQERRISRAALLADRYLQILRTRCEKLVAEVNETKRILMENNIMIEEHPSELGEDVLRIRYRAVPSNNRTMMARRRASIAAISRPLGNQQDVKENSRQRNSVSGRVTFRRPSLSYDTQKWENDKLVRTDSSSSMGELREIFEQAESRRNSREENNNVVRSPANYVNSANCETVEGETWSHTEETFPQESPSDEKISTEHTLQRQSSLSTIWVAVKQVLLHPLFWYMLISFFFGFYVKHVFSANFCTGTPFKWWSIEEMLEPYVQIKNTGPRPI